MLRELDRAGVLAVRRAVPAVAKALEVSRSTVYTLLAELRGTPGAADTPGAAETPGAADPRRPTRTDEGDPS